MPLFPEITPFKTGRLPLTDGHVMHYELSGNPKGTPVVSLHGGPGSGSSSKHHRYANPRACLTIVYDQRGCGKSTPKGSLKANTTKHLIADLERLRQHLKIERWVVTGTSWGSTLALAYAQAHPNRVMGLLVGGIFFGTRREMNWVFGPDGTARMYPAEFAALCAAAGLKPGQTVPSNLAKPLLKVMTGRDKTKAMTAARAMSFYELVAMEVSPNRAALQADVLAYDDVLVGSSILLHYDVNDSFLKPNQLLNAIGRIAHIPLHIVHGENDMVCPPESAYALHAAHPNSTLTMVPACGHRASPRGLDARVKALAKLLKSLKPDS